ncbi:endonuclease Q family protein [Cohnella lubricantis]|uniref:TIGR00375 family protein n=2 Tax=Cohnella lubricantis TaxID=2163172 RepID=A0A841TFD9_9BACL|nr:TIGR00375 family protein [Cohnella lubricantis]
MERGTAADIAPNPSAGQPLRSIFADLHVHIGRTSRDEPVKISASRSLTFRSIAHEASERKGVGLVGVIDCHSPAVQRDIQDCLDSGEMEEAEGGGIRYRDTVILLGCELEVMEPGGGPYHLLAYLPTFEAMQGWTAWMAPRMKNVNLSSQRLRTTAREVQTELLARGGKLVPAHIFTPHRGLLGCSADRLSDRLELEGIAAVELGLSADTAMASRLSQLDRYPFLTNSDAHSTGMIGRECNELVMAEPTFEEWVLALEGRDGRGIAANIGLHPKLGKYHTTYCASCKQAVGEEADTEAVCPRCGSQRLVRGVAGRIEQLADRGAGEGDVSVVSPSAQLPPSANPPHSPQQSHPPKHPPKRPPYRQQVPLKFFPGVGPKLLDRLLAGLGTEMDILHRLPIEAIAAVAGEKLAKQILAAREGKLELESGSGGTYGRIRGDQ